MARAGRPLGPLARAIITILVDRQLTAADVSVTLNESIVATVRQLSRLVASDHIEVVRTSKRPPAKRPVAVYAACTKRLAQDDLSQLWAHREIHQAWAVF